MSTPERIHTNGNSVPRLPEGPIAPPQNLEAEQSVLGAVLLSDTALPALIIDERLHPEDFYREAHGIVFAAMLDLHSGGEPVDALTLVEHLKQAGQLEQAGGRSAIDLLASSVPAVGHVRQYARIVRENAMLRRLLRAAYEIQARVHSHDAPPRELVDIAERSILEVAHEDSRKDFRAINDVLDVEITKLEQLSQEGKAITGTPSGFDDLDNITGGFQPGNLIVLAARPSMGKCLAGSTLVYDPRDGSRRRIDELAAAHEHGEQLVVASLNERQKLHRSSVSAVIRSGVQPVFRVTTKLGKQLDATANHPLLTLHGWRELGELQAGDRIAAPRNLPCPRERSTLPDHELVLLAALIADGNLTQSTPRFAFGPGSPVLGAVAAAAKEIGVQLHIPAAGHGTATLSNGRGGGINPVTELCRRHGLWGKGSRDKHVPDAIFGLEPHQIARFLGVLYGCDGHVHVSPRLCQIGYTTISERLARDVQHLLLRLELRRQDPAPEARRLRGDRHRRPRGAHHGPGGHRFLRRQGARRRQAGATSQGVRAPRVTRIQDLRRHRPGRSLGARPRGQGRAQLGDRQRERRPSSQSQLARRDTRPLTAAAGDPGGCDRRRAARRPRRVRYLVGRDRLDRAAR